MAAGRRCGTSSTRRSASSRSWPATPACRWAAGSGARSTALADLQGAQAAQRRPRRRDVPAAGCGRPCRWACPTSTRPCRAAPIDGVEFLGPASDLAAGLLPDRQALLLADLQQAERHRRVHRRRCEAWDALPPDLQAVVAHACCGRERLHPGRGRCPRRRGAGSAGRRARGRAAPLAGRRGRGGARQAAAELLAGFAAAGGIEQRIHDSYQAAMQASGAVVAGIGRGLPGGARRCLKRRPRALDRRARPGLPGHARCSRTCASASSGGSWTCLLGPSGVGKTTPAAPDRRARRRARWWSPTTARRSSGRVALMAQQDLLLPWLPVRRQRAAGLPAARRGRAELRAPARAGATQLLARVGLERQARRACRPRSPAACASARRWPAR